MVSRQKDKKSEAQEAEEFVEFLPPKKRMAQSLTSDLDFSHFDEKLIGSRIIFKIPVKDGVSRCNILAITFVAVTSFILSTFLNAQLIFLLANPDFFGVPKDKMGYVSGMLSFVSTPGAILGSIFAGYFYDIFGRRFTIGFGLFSSSILLSLVPWTSPDIFPWLITVRIAFSMFIAVPI